MGNPVKEHRTQKSTWAWCERVGFVVSVALALAGPTPFAGASAADVDEALAPAAALLTPPEQAVAPAAAPANAAGTAATLNCAHPIPGDRAMLIGEDEVAWSITPTTTRH